MATPAEGPLSNDSIAREEYYLDARGPTQKPKLIQDVNYTKAYRVMIAERLQNVDFSNRTTSPLQAFSTRTSMTLGPTRLWAAARTQFGIPKSGDLLWRLLH